MEKVTQNVPDTGCTDPDEFVNDLCIEDEELLYIITLILGIIGVVLPAFAIREDDRAFPLEILSVVSLICSVWHQAWTRTTLNNNFNFCWGAFSIPTVRTISAEMPDGCFVYSVDQDSMYTWPWEHWGS